MRVVSLFAGIGGFDLGFERAGMQVVFQCEKHTFAQRILKTHWPDVPLHDDILTLQPLDIPPAELYCGGFPCQDVSLANQGKRKGLNGARSGLFFKFAELVQHNTPAWIVLENVFGLLNSQNGEDFRVILNTLDEIGYCVAWRVLDAKYFGTPQRRRRVFLVASYQSRRAITVLFDREISALALKKSRRKKEAVPSNDGTSHNESTLYVIQHAALGRNHRAGPQGPGYRNDGETWTLDRRGAADAVCETNDAFRIRGTTRVPEGMDRRRYEVLGNAVCVPIVTWIGKRILAVERGEICSEVIIGPDQH